MDTGQLARLGEKLLYGSRVRFLGVYPANMIPASDSILQFPSCFIANIDPAFLPGTHWVAFYYETAKNLDFFDSSGHSPSYYSFAIHSNTQINFNPFVIQSLTSDVCGEYCLFFLYFRSRNNSLSSISRLLYKSSKTDSHIRRFIKKLAIVIQNK